MKRDEVRAKLKDVDSEIKKIKATPEVEYVTGGVYVPGVGHMRELVSLQELVKAHAIIIKTKIDLEQSAKELDIELEDSEFEFQNVKISDWEKDIKNRRDEVILENRLSQLEKASAILTKNLSEDDLFEIEMDGISNVLKTV